ncbi:glucosaminidase domain-containing protein [Flavobacterium sp.]|uniref:glucosaminidase domain-containing protein n=1 Tax=Flavobacterium sp. TaxID=239 RepID=UPI0037523AA9
MIKKIILYCCVSFFISCGSNKAVVRTSRSVVSPSKPVARTIRKPVVKPVTKPIVVKVLDTKPVVVGDNKDISTEILEATTRVKVTTAMVLEYIEKYKEIAKKDMIEYGIPASITLGQGILESGAGTGPLSVQANNHFGIKCHKEWTGPSVKYDDDEAQECFRKYDNPNDSYRDHSLFLTTRERYSSLFKLDKNDYKGWAKGLKNAGYATDIAYPTKLIGLVERYQLQKYDAEVLGVDYVPTKIINTIDTTKMVGLSDADLHQVIKGDTLYSISKRYNISIEELKKKNNILDSGISIGQKIIVK